MCNIYKIKCLTNFTHSVNTHQSWTCYKYIKGFIGIKRVLSYNQHILFWSNKYIFNTFFKSILWFYFAVSLHVSKYFYQQICADVFHLARTLKYKDIALNSIHNTESGCKPDSMFSFFCIHLMTSFCLVKIQCAPKTYCMHEYWVHNYFQYLSCMV